MDLLGVITGLLGEKNYMAGELTPRTMVSNQLQSGDASSKFSVRSFPLQTRTSVLDGGSAPLSNLISNFCCALVSAASNGVQSWENDSKSKMMVKPFNGNPAGLFSDLDFHSAVAILFVASNC